MVIGIQNIISKTKLHNKQEIITEVLTYKQSVTFYKKETHCTKEYQERKIIRLNLKINLNQTRNS